MNNNVIVVGGGVIGICTAYYLMKEGVSVTVIEKEEVGSGCSFGNAGYVSPSHFIPLASPGIIAKGLRWMLNPVSPFYIKPRLDVDLISWLLKFRDAANPARASRAMPVLAAMNLASAGLFKELATAEGLDFSFKNNGLFMLYNTDKGEKEELETASKAKQVGIEARPVTREEINELDPCIRTHARGGVYYPQDCHMEPARFVQGLGRYVERNGVKILSSTTVLGFEKSDGRITVVRTSGGDLAAGEIVLAGGSWSPGIVRDLHIKLPVQPAKGYSVTIENPPRKMSVPVMLTEAKVAITPMGEKLRFAGTLELAGHDLSINTRRVHAILNAVPRYLADINPSDFMSIEPWAGLRPCSPDGLPFVGRFQAFNNLIAATGHAMLGLSLAPITGKLVSEIITRKSPTIGLDLLQPDRFS